MRADVAALLRCPHCESALGLDGRTLRCANGHAFDLARQGYANLLPGQWPATRADTAEMVAAREAFLTAGHFDPLITAVAETVAAHAPPGALLDLGAGTGRYLAAALDRVDGHVGLAVDLSKHAARRAARAHPRAGAVVCDVWRPLPVRTGVAAAALDIFAPRNPAELARVLTADGALVVVTPTPAHLAELVAPLGLLSVESDKDDRTAVALAPSFEPGPRRLVEFGMALSQAAAERIAAMGPSAWHTDAAAVAAAVAELAEPVAVTASVDVTVHRPRRGR